MENIDANVSEMDGDDYHVTMVAELMEQSLNVENFWEYFASQADKDGNLGKEAFHNMIKSVIMNAPSLTRVVEAFTESLSTSFYQLANIRADTEKMNGKVKERILNSLGLITNALFKFFDSDSNGSVSKEEFVAAVSFFADRGTPDFKLMIKSFFRVLDDNKNGVIESIELVNFFSDILNTVISLIEAIIEEIEPIFEVTIKNKMRQLFSKISEKNRLNINKSVASTVEDILGLINGTKNEEDLPPVSQFLNGAALNLSGMIAGMPFLVDPILLESWNGFLSEFEARATGPNSELAKSEVVKLASASFNKCVDKLLNDNLLSGLLSGFLSEANVPVPDPNMFGDVISSSSASLRAFLRGGGLKRFFEAVFNFIDVNNDGMISHQELTGLWDASNKLYESMQQEDFQNSKTFETALKDFLCLLMKLFDANDDGVLDPSDIESVLDKLFELFKSLSFLLTSCAKQTLNSSLMPVVNVALSMKPFFVPGSFDTDGITENDLLTLLSIFDSPEEPAGLDIGSFGGLPMDPEMLAALGVNMQDPNIMAMFGAALGGLNMEDPNVLASLSALGQDPAAMDAAVEAVLSNMMSMSSTEQGAAAMQAMLSNMQTMFPGANPSAEPGTGSNPESN